MFHRIPSSSQDPFIPSIRKIPTDTAPLTSLALSPDQKQLFSADESGNIFCSHLSVVEKKPQGKARAVAQAQSSEAELAKKAPIMSAVFADAADGGKSKDPSEERTARLSGTEPVQSMEICLYVAEFGKNVLTV